MSGGESWTINNADQRKMLIEYIESNKDKPLTFKVVRQQRTPRQNNAIWAYCAEVAEQMLAMGKDMRTVLKEGVPIDPTKQLIHDQIWMPVQAAITGKTESTTELDKREVNQVYQVIAKVLAENHGISVRFGKEW